MSKNAANTPDFGLQLILFRFNQTCKFQNGLGSVSSAIAHIDVNSGKDMSTSCSAASVIKTTEQGSGFAPTTSSIAGMLTFAHYSNRKV